MDMAEALNLGCACTTLRPELLPPELVALAASHPHLFSASPFFLGARDATLIATAVQSLHALAALPGFRAQALARAGAIAQADPGPAGVFMGYDFHLAADGPRLIEINTNAGGAFLHAAALGAHRGCCDRGLAGVTDPLLPGEFQAALIAMFQDEWCAHGAAAPLRRIAIVDDAPATQYLAPEFELARAAFQRAGIDAVVADPGELRWRDGRLWHGPHIVDLVYNRLTDFDLSHPGHAALRQAYEARAVCLTPHPHAHAVHADKRNLIALSDGGLLARIGAAEADRALLAQVVPATQLVTADNADGLWAARRQLFFKPAGGYGSKAAYRGEKLTKRVWEEIRAGGFVAQAMVPPSERAVPLADGSIARLRVDVRAYAYRGRVLMLAARAYAGQTTNFRTPGGGFAPVVILPSLPALLGSGCPPALASSA